MVKNNDRLHKLIYTLQFHGHLFGHYVPFWVSVELGALDLSYFSLRFPALN